MRGWRAGLVSLGGLLLLVGSFWMGRSTGPTEQAPAAGIPSLEAENAAPDASEQALQRERTRNRELAAQVAWLQAQVAMLGDAEARPLEPEGAPDDTTAEQDPAEEPEATDEHWFDAEELQERGLPEGEVARLQEMFNEAEMQRIELQHRAEREGWLNKPRFWREMVALRFAMREEIGDENYDLMLYATGRRNRVVIRDLLENSPGQTYGFVAGDVVMSYGGERVFHGRELRRATAQGERGDWVTVDVLRDGEIVRIRAQRGPLGARLRPARILPESLW